MIAPLASFLTESLRHPEKPLALVGGIALGAFVLNQFAVFLMGKLTKKPMPAWFGRFLRAVGGATGGYIIYMMLFGGTGGGTGEGNLADNKPMGSNNLPVEISFDKRTDLLQPAIIKVRVLTDPKAREISKGQTEAKSHYIIMESPQNLVSLEDLLKELEARQKPPSKIRKIQIILGKQDPDKDTPRVQRITDWAEAKNIAIDFLPLESE